MTTYNAPSNSSTANQEAKPADQTAADKAKNAPAPKADNANDQNAKPSDQAATTATPEAKTA